MRIEFRKSRKGKDVLFCERDDGSTTWSELIEGSGNPNVFVPHDLIHYVVETTLGLTRGFFGQIENGLDLQESLGANEKRAMRNEPDVLRAEAVAAVAYAEAREGPFTQTEFASRLAVASEHWNADAKPVSEEELDKIRTMVLDLGTMWRQLQPGEKLICLFPRNTA